MNWLFMEKIGAEPLLSVGFIMLLLEPVLLNGQPFGMMQLALYTGSQAIWPEGAITNDAGTWQEINNEVCQ